MSIVRINVLEVPEGHGEELERRFANRAGEVEKTPGFESFELLRPTDGSGRYFVYTRWESEEAFDAWVSSERFERGHAQSAEEQPEDAAAPHGEDTPHGHGGSGGQRPAATGSELLAFDVVLSAEAG
ncbi:MAG: antibiotic biosynthesis monooxygenase [Nitriliruptorales bacterium]|nr:antibiotic biosynthesis monooxygenase [Nitriliruptorales bacterium]